jgi:hypothetical protein
VLDVIFQHALKKDVVHSILFVLDEIHEDADVHLGLIGFLEIFDDDLHDVLTLVLIELDRCVDDDGRHENHVNDTDVVGLVVVEESVDAGTDGHPETHRLTD